MSLVVSRSATGRLRVAASLALVALVVAACRTSDSRVAGTDARLRYVGRVERLASSVRMAWPATTLSFRVERTLWVKLYLRNVPLPDETPETDDLAVSVDGAPWRLLPLSAGDGTYVLADPLTAGPHTIVVGKRTEAEVGTVEIQGVEVAPQGRVLAPPPAAARRIEILGDSVTAGFGSEGQGPLCPWRAREENALSTYGALAAHELAADYVALAASGKGVVRNADSRDGEPLPVLFERTLPLEPGSWTFAGAPLPDVVLVNLGANDFLLGAPDEAAFRRAYARLIARVRQVYPRAFIVLVLGPMLWDEARHDARSLMRAWLDAIIRDRAGAGDTRLALLEQWADPREPVGCQFHPSEESHRRFAAELVSFLKPLLKW